MVRVTTRGVLLSGAFVTAGLMIPQAAASLSGSSAPVGIAVYAQVNSDLCASWSQYKDDGTVFQADVCAGRKLAARVDSNASSPAKAGIGYPVYVWVTHCTPDDGTGDNCDSGFYQGNLDQSSFTISPALDSGSVHANVNGCQLDVTVSAASQPEEGTALYRSVSPNGTVRVDVSADEGVRRDGVSSGSICGVKFPSGQGILAHAVNAKVHGYAQPPGS